ncbi:MAG: cell division protein FtsQ [Agathobacter sp.]|nr:cell division protein FtsQ [Agathobacter sp.]
MSSENKEKKQKNFKILKIVGGVAFLLAVTAVIVLKVFTVKKVQIEGNELYDDEVIETSVLNDKYSWNSLYVFLKYKFVDTEEIPFIETMEISLKNPHTLNISVYEKGMMGYIYIPGISENAYFDKDGLVVEISSDIIEKVPQVKGIDCDEVVLYEKLPVKSKDLREILTLTQTLKRNKLVPDVITYGVDNEPKLKYGKIKVLVGSTKLLTKKIERLSAIMPAIDKMSGTLHLESWTEESTNIVFDKEETEKK